MTLIFITQLFQSSIKRFLNTIILPILHSAERDGQVCFTAIFVAKKNLVEQIVYTKGLVVTTFHGCAMTFFS